MSVSIPDPQSVEPSETTLVAMHSAEVVQLPLDPAALRRQEARRVTESLREQIALLSQHYAQDTTRLHEALESARQELARAEQAHAQERTRSATFEAELFRAHGDALFIRERLARERRRAAALAEVARLPWWAFARRHWALATIDTDDAS